MSYCRFSEGDVYMYASTHGGIECCACRLAPKVPTICSPVAHARMPDDDARKQMVTEMNLLCSCGNKCEGCTMHDSVTLHTYDAAIEHLKEHRRAGHKVPRRAFRDLKRDKKEGYPLAPNLCACGNPVSAVDLRTGESKCFSCMLEEADSNSA